MKQTEIKALEKIRNDLFNAMNRKDMIDIGFAINDLDNYIYKNTKKGIIQKSQKVENIKWIIFCIIYLICGVIYLYLYLTL
jgi:hypothetical protein